MSECGDLLLEAAARALPLLSPPGSRNVLPPLSPWLVQHVIQGNRLPVAIPALNPQGLQVPPSYFPAPHTLHAIGPHNPLANTGVTVVGNPGQRQMADNAPPIPRPGQMPFCEGPVGMHALDNSTQDFKRTRKRSTRLAGHRGIFVKDSTNRTNEVCCEARLEVCRLCNILSESVSESMGKVVHLGTRLFNRNDDEDMKDAIMGAEMSLDRAIIKLMEVHNVPLDEFEQALHFPYSGYTPGAGKGLSFAEYVSEIRDEAARRRPAGTVPQARKWKVLCCGQHTQHEHYHKKPYALTMDLVSRVSFPKCSADDTGMLQSFGTYKQKTEAATAFDIGTILAYGTDQLQRMNHPLTKYMQGGHFLNHVKIPRTVIESVQYYLDCMVEEDQQLLLENLARIRSYYADGETCPFYDSRHLS